MMGRRPREQSLYSADTQCLEFVGEDTFYGFLARHGRELFPDDQFAEIYCDGFGRPSKAPGMLAIALLLQAHDGVSDAEATARAAYDMCWKVALGVEMDERPFAKSTLQLFRAQLVIHEKAQAIFRRSLAYAWERGYRIKEGTAKDRVPSVHDPEQRHGHKSHGRSLTGHKAAVAADVDSRVISDVEVTPGNEPDGKSAAGLVERSEEALSAGFEETEEDADDDTETDGVTVEQVIGDTAYGSTQVRKEPRGGGHRADGEGRPGRGDPQGRVRDRSGE